MALFAGSLTAQSTLQVVTKRIEKTFTYKKGYELNIEGEKAKVEVNTWNREEIQIIMELTAKHPDKKVAENDLEAMKYLADRIRNKIYLRNYVSLAEGAPKPQSELSARYVITLPEECQVYLKNYFGIAQINDLSGGLRVRSEYSRVGLSNVRGQVDLVTRFGDLIGEKLNGTVNIDSRRADLTLRDIQGHYNIRAAYGTLNLFLTSGLAELDIQGDKTDIFLNGDNLQQYGFALTARNGNILMPDEMPFQYLNNAADLKKIQFKPKQEYYANITISITLGNISIKNKP